MATEITTQGILVALIPAIGWGLMPLVAKWSKGKAEEQLLGTSLGALLFAVAFFIIVQPDLTVKGFFVSALSGLFWSIGQYFIFRAFEYSSISNTMSIAISIQLIGSTLISLIIFREWERTSNIILGLVVLAMIVVAIFMINYSNEKEKSSKKGLFFTIIGGISFILYVVTNHAFGVSGTSIIFPQAIGVVITTIAICLIRKAKLNKVDTAKNVVTGLIWAVANAAMFIATSMVGVTVAITLSELQLIISSTGSIVIFHEKKTKQEMRLFIIALVMIFVGAVLIALLGNN